MSKYFQALRRLQTGSVDSPAGREGVQIREIEVPQERGLPFSALPLASRQAAFASLLDFLRARVQGATPRAVVVAGVSELELVSPIVQGLASLAEFQDLKMQVQDLRHAGKDGGRIRNQVTPPTRPPQDLETLVVIWGPPLSASIEAALQGAACAGLLLVVEPLVTRKDALRSAVEKVTLSECDLLGVVSLEGRNRIPAWLKRLTAAPKR